MKKTLKFALSALAFAVLGYVLYPTLINSMVFHPSRYIAHVEKQPYLQERYITASDDVTIHAYYLTHKDSTRRLLIYFHGNAGNNSHLIDEAAAIYNMGADVLLVSYRGYGRSKGSPTEQGIYIDAESSYRYALDELKYRSTNIFVLGRSIGSTAAVNVAQHKKLAGVILITPLSSGPDMAAHMGLGFIKTLVAGMFDNMAKIDNIKAPLLIIHGTGDEVVPYDQGRMLYDTFKGVKKFVTIPLGGHNTLQDQDPKAYWGAIADFVK